MMRDDGEVPVLDANSLGLLPDASGPWLPLPAAGLSLDNRDLSATAKRVVGMALAPVGSGKQMLPLLTVDAVRAVKNGQPWTAASKEGWCGRDRGSTRLQSLQERKSSD